MQNTEERIELARAGALSFAKDQGSSPTAAEAFADDYVCVLEDRAHEVRYPDLADPTPEEVWFS
ncbi:hypothetical protein DC31_00325 [Microbacterium sp. CH12i]|uniref:hypothetical protein n=1 Tax=Microbacterium sp. CH12i TaxID=1479651 RepID=UPI0004616832|nr:hypothetical protein [Microbacterium sp. CH12i]KDA07195.1 hypothetical protein DC31_00325 [Microbacterium sp. CH12i]